MMPDKSDSTIWMRSYGKMLGDLKAYGYDSVGGGIKTPATRSESHSKTQRERLLDEAREIITQGRNRAYGEPEDNSSRIAEFWNAFLRTRKDADPTRLAPYEVFVLMTLMKIARIQYDPSNYDSYLDAAAYMAVAWDSYHARGENEPE